MSQTHTVQGFSGGRWANLGSKRFYVNSPVARVWYYAPSTSSSGSIHKATSLSPTCTKS